MKNRKLKQVKDEYSLEYLTQLSQDQLNDWMISFKDLSRSKKTLLEAAYNAK